MFVLIKEFGQEPSSINYLMLNELKLQGKQNVLTLELFYSYQSVDAPQVSLVVGKQDSDCTVAALMKAEDNLQIKVEEVI